MERTQVLWVVLALGIGALVVRYVSSWPDYSLKEVRQQLTDFCNEYGGLRQQKAGEAQWQEFQRRVKEVTEPMIADMMKKHPSGEEKSRLIGFAKVLLPRAIASRGQQPLESLTVYLEPRVSLIVPVAPRRHIDYLTLGIVIADGGMILWIGYLAFGWVKDVQTQTAASALQRLNLKVARLPESVHFRSARAKLLEHMGRYEEAMADIDWILEHRPPGARLDDWQRHREAVAEKGEHAS